MEKRLLIIANSDRPSGRYIARNGRCIAGICLETEKLIRPITTAVPGKSHAIEEDEVSHIDLLDEVVINLVKKPCKDDYQKENYEIINNRDKNNNWEIVQKNSSRDQNSKNKILKLLKKNSVESEMLFKEKWQGEKDIPKDKVKNQPPDKKESLWIVETYAELKYKEEYTNKSKWRAFFVHDRRRGLPITDPKIKNSSRDKLTGQYIFTISLTQPFEKTEKCHLLVAGIVGL